MERDYMNLTKLYPFDKVYFVSDSFKSWRKEFYTEYKSTGKKDDKINWNFVYSEFVKFKEDFLETRKNCAKFQVENLEGDDVISYITKKLNDKGQSMLIVSNDSDLYQLLKYDLDKRYLNMMYNSKMIDDRIYIPEHYNILTKQLKDNYVDDIFEDNNEIEFLSFISDMVKTRKVTHINAELELFMKVMGHNKDNIKSILLKGNRGVGKTGIIKVYMMYKETYPEPIDFNSAEFRKRLIEHIKLYKRIKDHSYDNMMNERLTTNLKLVKLDEESLPNYLYERMKKEVIL